MSSWYKQYTGKNIGRVLHFLNVYCGLRVAEEATVGGSTVYFFGRLLANYHYETIEVKGLDGFTFTSENVPVFEFVGHPNISRNPPTFTHEQKRLQASAILQSMVHEVEGRKKELENKLHQPQTVKNIYQDFPFDKKFTDAVAEIDRIRAAIALVDKELARVRPHEFDYIKVEELYGRDSIGRVLVEEQGNDQFTA